MKFLEIQVYEGDGVPPWSGYRHGDGCGEGKIPEAEFDGDGLGSGSLIRTGMGKGNGWGGGPEYVYMTQTGDGKGFDRKSLPGEVVNPLAQSFNSCGDGIDNGRNGNGFVVYDSDLVSLGIQDLS